MFFNQSDSCPGEGLLAAAVLCGITGQGGDPVCSGRGRIKLNKR